MFLLSIGVKGDRGFHGISGPEGLTGVQGDKGSTGPAGLVAQGYIYLYLQYLE